MSSRTSWRTTQPPPASQSCSPSTSSRRSESPSHPGPRPCLPAVPQSPALVQGRPSLPGVISFPRTKERRPFKSSESDHRFLGDEKAHGCDLRRPGAALLCPRLSRGFQRLGSSCAPISPMSKRRLRVHGWEALAPDSELESESKTQPSSRFQRCRAPCLPASAAGRGGREALRCSARSALTLG